MSFPHYWRLVLAFLFLQLLSGQYSAVSCVSWVVVFSFLVAYFLVLQEEQAKVLLLVQQTGELHHQPVEKVEEAERLVEDFLFGVLFEQLFLLDCQLAVKVKKFIYYSLRLKYLEQGSQTYFYATHLKVIKFIPTHLICNKDERARARASIGHGFDLYTRLRVGADSK